jgi:hypothetical protein
MANVFVAIGKGFTLAAEDVLHWGAEGRKVLANFTPTTIAALAVLASGVEKCIEDGLVDAATPNPLALLITVPDQLKDFVAVWPELKLVLDDLGITNLSKKS